MLNFRKLKQDFSPSVLKEGKTLYDKKMVLSVKIVSLTAGSVRLSCRVQGNFDNYYESELEIDRSESSAVHSDCDCSYKYDCQHLAGVLFYLEEHFDELIVAYSQEADLETFEQIEEEEKEQLRETFKEAKTKQVIRHGKKCKKEMLQEYTNAAAALGRSPFFSPEEQLDEDKAELAVIFAMPPQKAFDSDSSPEIQLALRLPSRSKPLHIPDVKEFLDCVRYNERLYIGSKRYFFGLGSFDATSLEILQMLMDYARIPGPDAKGERNARIAQLGADSFGAILARAFDLAIAKNPGSRSGEGETPAMPCLYCASLEQPLCYSNTPVVMRFKLEYLKAPEPKILLNPSLVLEGDKNVKYDDACLFESAKPGMIFENVYYRFQPQIRRKHLRHLNSIRDITIPEPLFGTFVENALPELARFAEVSHDRVLENFITLPYVGELQGECDISYLDGELEATLYFIYGAIKVPAALSKLSNAHIDAFVNDQGILARNLTQEQKIIDDLFQDFVFDEKQGCFIAKAEKKIVEFMTEVIPRNQPQVTFNCPENLLDQFIYDNTRFKLHLKETDRIDKYKAELKVDGHLKGVTVDLLWDCLASKRPFIELQKKKVGRSATASRAGQPNKILVLNLAELAPVVQIFDELGINVLDDHAEDRPLWSLASIHSSLFDNVPITFSMSDKLMEIQAQVVGSKAVDITPIPGAIQTTLRGYQVDGVNWLERLRTMHLSGILADDMGLGKTVQAITAITQYIDDNKDCINLVVCPTSLVYNWKEEFTKFNPGLRVLPVDGTPVQRKKLLDGIKDFDVVITSYSLLQKDIDFYKTVNFSYAILDEAQHIKNRGTRNAKSVKMVQASHRLILTGTPIENSLEELWSLFDFLLPGLLSSYDRFIEKYVRNVNGGEALVNLRRKVSPFILRRMKKDILQELPPVSEIVYHCHLSEAQRELYRSYANSAREELSKLVNKEGFDKVQIHVLATLTRLKQICCHPAIFAKDKAEGGDSSKYDMLLELLQTLIDGKHKVVIFSQYTRMLKIIRDDLEQMGINFSYLDGSSKNRMSIVREFNENENIPIFLVSLKAGGAGLNLTGADTVIHYDMWWNPAVENQATDRVHRIGQTASVSSYKLVTLNTIEEKILELQNRKRGLVKKVVSCDEEAVAKLTWEEVLELLQV
ncbi:MAG: SNF2-related protein [Chlamydiales bacterium]|nr:SNF2-related protein [Chlamydiales bacterium]